MCEGAVERDGLGDALVRAEVRVERSNHRIEDLGRTIHRIRPGVNIALRDYDSIFFLFFLFLFVNILFAVGMQLNDIIGMIFHLLGTPVDC